MKLFFSYGHDKNETIVLRLKSDIEKRKHTVWIDKSEIKSGDDWRRSITSGILDSEFMVSFASNHSVRKPGVCLDELRIAVSVKGAQVQAVLLESDVIPPTNIGYRQYIDMSNWMKMKDSPDFEDWYAEKLKEIIEIIESPETVRYAEEMEYLKEKLHPDLSSAKKERLQQEYFCGREWLAKGVRDWLSNQEASKILLIDGAPGIGKSSFMAHEFAFNSSVGSILFCEWDNASFNNLDSISRCLVFQLASKITDYRHQIVQCLKSGQQQEESSYHSRSGDDVFKFLLLQQLRSLIDGNRPTLLILIDGIDELSDKNDGRRRRNILAEILQQEINNFPRWIRFVITSRCDSRVTVPLQDAAVIHMDESEGDNAKDIRKYLMHELGEQLSADEINRIAYKSEGNFLYARMTAESLKKGRVSIREVMDGQNGDLGYVYRRYFDRVFDRIDEYEEIYYPAIAALSVTEERIPVETFQRITGWTKRKQAQYLKTLSPFLSVGRDYLGLYHKSLQDWLLSYDADEYLVDDIDGIKGISEGCFRAYEEHKNEMNIFELKYLIPYLKRSKDVRLKKVLEDEQYAEVLMIYAKSEADAFRYENALDLGEMAYQIYANISMYEDASRAALFLAEITDLMVCLEESVKWCENALAIVKKEKHLTRMELPGDIWMRLSYVYFRQNKWEESVAGYKTAYEHFEKCGNINKEIESMMMCANAQRNATDYMASIELFERIEQFSIYENLQENDPILYTNLLMYHGWALHASGNYKVAGKYLVEAENMLKSSNVRIPTKDIAQIYYLRAVELFNQADYPLAKDYCMKSLHYVRQAYGDSAVEVCSALNQLGAIVQKQNNHSEAVKVFKQSYEIRRNYYGEENLFTSISLRNYAKALVRRGVPEDLEPGKRIFEKVKNFREKLAASGEGLGWLAQIYLDLAEYHANEGKSAMAEEYAVKSKELYEQHGSKRDVSSCERQLGIIKFSAGDYESARQAFERALEISSTCYDEAHPYVKDLNNWLGKCDKKKDK